MFNSVGFIFIFPAADASLLCSCRPATVAIGRDHGVDRCIIFVLRMWEPGLLLLLTASTAFNYAIAQLIMYMVWQKCSAFARLVLIVGTCGDVSLLAYFAPDSREVGVHLHFFITPSPARQFEGIYLLGLSQLYQQWVRELAIELAKGNDSAGDARSALRAQF